MDTSLVIGQIDSNFLVSCSFVCLLTAVILQCTIKCGDFIVAVLCGCAVS